MYTADYQGQYTDIDAIRRHHVATDHAALCDETHLAANALQLKEILQNPLRLDVHNNSHAARIVQ